MQCVCMTAVHSRLNCNHLFVFCRFLVGRAYRCWCSLDLSIEFWVVLLIVSGGFKSKRLFIIELASFLFTHPNQPIFFAFIVLAMVSAFKNHHCLPHLDSPSSVFTGPYIFFLSKTANPFSSFFVMHIACAAYATIGFSAVLFTFYFSFYLFSYYAGMSCIFIRTLYPARILYSIPHFFLF